MNNVKGILNNWLDSLDDFKFPEYHEFPDIELYMDQVITYLDRELKVLQTSSLDKIITPSMINNYVKGQVVSAPIAKKYNREHLALINETCTLKQVLSISEIKQILDLEYKDNNIDAYSRFKEQSEDEFKEVVKLTKSELEVIEDENDVAALNRLALKLAIASNAYNTVAKRILYYTKKYSDMKEINEELNKEKQND